LALLAIRSFYLDVLTNMTKPGNDTPQIIASPPILFLGTLLISFLLNYMFPTGLSGESHILVICAGMIFLLSAAFARCAFKTMHKQKTSPNPYKVSEHLTTLGPFKYSRNPIYLAMTGLYIAIGSVMNSIWPFVLLLHLLLIMHWGVVLREEKYLTSRFGEAYLTYKKVVPRWLLIH
jgi:protein-S-isoprenylcysteine O-methyltransferase Ste14